MRINNYEDGLYIQLFNIHGLFRGKNLELGRNSDTGGQTGYVLDLALALSAMDKVKKVEVLTRYIQDKDYSEDYSKVKEKVNDKFDIVRIKCGGNKYIRKELLWDHLEEFIDKTIKYIKSVEILPNVIHSHYADAGYVCSNLSKFLGVPFIHTGHSLGLSKYRDLKNEGMTDEEINKKYRMNLRVKAEEEVLYYADRIITSSNHEIKSQYSVYENYNSGKFTIIPPGVDLSRFYPYNEKREWDEDSQKVRNNVREELWKFFTNMHKPIILALCRPERKKNIDGIINAYGHDKELQQKANLAIFAGLRRDITIMPELEREVLTEMLLLMDKYNLYGKMAIPKRHDFEHEVPELYRIAAESQGVFVNAAHNEPFGLTIIEAAASGLPVVVTENGGPTDIIKNLKHGVLVDVSDPENISRGISDVLSDEKKWREYSSNGYSRVNHFYSWEAHSQNYLEMLDNFIKDKVDKTEVFVRAKKKLLSHKKMMIFDIDDTLIGADRAPLEELQNIIKENEDHIAFGVATGRTIDSAREVLSENNFILPDLIISSVGSEIYYKDKENNYISSRGWEKHISHLWKKEKILNLLDEFDFIELQEDETQRKHKVSYYLDADESKLKDIREKLMKYKIKANLIISHNKFLDILPYRASKGRAVRYQSYRWNIALDNILVAGDSGNDEDMLRGELRAIVVGKHSKELEKLKGRRRIYFAEKAATAGILEGINYYNFLEKEIRW